MTLTPDELTDLIGNRRYCFVIMAFKKDWAFYTEISKVLEVECGIRCVRADEVPVAGELLLDKVHQLIDNAELVMADLSENRPNLYYEVGYAKARGKRVLIICKRGSEFDVNLHGIERIEYENTRDGLPSFHSELKQHVLALLESDRLLLRSILLAPRSLPSFLLASPRWDTARTRSEETRERRTYGDYLGVVGIISAFGALLGQEGVPELISARHAYKDLLEQDCNLYLIGSPRANDLTGAALAWVQGKGKNHWQLDSSEGSDKSRLVGYRGGAHWEWEADHSVSVPAFDYGLFLRGPHPVHEGRMIMILAGMRSLGTGGVCLAVTRPRLIQRLCEKLGLDTLADKKKVIWALIRVTPDPVDNHASVEHTEIEDTGVCEA